MPRIEGHLRHRWAIHTLGGSFGFGCTLWGCMVHLLVDLIQVELNEPKKSDMTEFLAALVGLGEPCEVLGLPHHVLEFLSQVRLAKVDRTLAQFAEWHLHNSFESPGTVTSSADDRPVHRTAWSRPCSHESTD